MLRNLFILLVFVFTPCILSENVEIDFDIYYQLPKLNDLDDFEQCSFRTDNVIYCVFEVKLRPLPNKTSHIYSLIEYYNKDPRNLRHDIIRRGRCLESKNVTKKQLISEHKPKFDELVKNDSMENWIDPKDVFCYHFNSDFDWADIMAMFVIGLVLLVVITATVFDTTYTTSHKEISNPPLIVRLILCFSLWKNWVRLSRTKDAKENLKFVQGLRFFSMLIIIFGHVEFMAFSNPVENPIYFERNYRTLWIGIVTNGAVIVQNFFFLGGMVLALPLYELMDKRSFNFSYIWLAILGRFIRLTPSYAFVILINATLAYHWGAGPYWEEIVGTERQNCRESWWVNLLYVSNEMKMEKMCLINGWYVAADFQMFVVALVILSLIWVFKKHIKSILTVCLLTSILIPSIITYIKHLDPIFLSYPETLRRFFAGDATFSNQYLPFYSNFSGYALGMIFSYLLYTGKLKKQVSIFKSTFWGTLIVLPLGLLLSLGVLVGSTYFYSDWYSYNIWVSTLVSGLYKPVFIMTFFLGAWFVFQEGGVVIRSIFEWRIFFILGRLTFGVYLINFPLIKAQIGLHHTPIHFSFYTQVLLFVTNVVVSYALALLLCLFIEVPVSRLSKLLFKAKLQKMGEGSRDDLCNGQTNNSSNATINEDQRNGVSISVIEIEKFGGVIRKKDEF